MKRFLLVLICGIAYNSFCAAQVMLGNYNQRGNATTELPGEGLIAAHNILPLSSKAIVKNTQNGKEVEVTIVGRIPPSLERIIDLSAAAAAAVDLPEGGAVIIHVPYVPLPRPAAAARQAPAAPAPDNSAEEAPAAAAEPPALAAVTAASAEETAAGTEEPSPAPESGGGSPAAVATGGEPKPAVPARQETAPFNLTIRIEVNVAAPQPAVIAAPQPAAQPVSGWTPAAGSTAAASTAAAVPGGNSFPCISNAQILPSLPASSGGKTYRLQSGNSLPCAGSSAPAAVPAGSSSQRANVRVLPRLPDPASGKTYRLQVGSYSLPGNAERVISRLQSAGFRAEQEISGTVRRVLAAGIPAAGVYSAAQRLGALGFAEILVRE